MQDESKVTYNLDSLDVKIPVCAVSRRLPLHRSSVRGLGAVRLSPGIQSQCHHLQDFHRSRIIFAKTDFRNRFTFAVLKVNLFLKSAFHTIRSLVRKINKHLLDLPFTCKFLWWGWAAPLGLSGLSPEEFDSVLVYYIILCFLNNI